MSRTPINSALVHNDATQFDATAVSSLSGSLEPIVRPYVKAALKAELVGQQTDAVLREAVLAASTVLGVASEPATNELRHALKHALGDSSEIGDEEISQHTRETAFVMTSAWIQFLELGLGSRPELALGTNLLPSNTDVDPALWERLRRSLASLVISPDVALNIMAEFGEALMKSELLQLSSGLVIQRQPKLVLRRLRQSAS